MPEANRERAARIAARAIASVDEAIVVATSATRPSNEREEVMEKLESKTWLGRCVALQGMLGLVSHLSHIMQTVNTIPWELMVTQRDLYDKIVSMEASLREKTKTTDPRWSCTPPDPFPALGFPFFHEDPDPKHHPGVSRIQMLKSGTYMGQQLVVLIDDRNEGLTN
jgi:hypothetical protein